MKASEKALVLEVLLQILHTAEVRYQEAKDFVVRYDPFPSDYLAIAVALDRVGVAQETLNRMVLLLDLIPTEPN